MVKPRRNPKTKQVESFDRMLRRFKKICDKKGIVKECRDRQYYVKPNDLKNQRIRQSREERNLIV